MCKSALFSDPAYVPPTKCRSGLLSHTTSTCDGTTQRLKLSGMDQSNTMPEFYDEPSQFHLLRKRLQLLRLGCMSVSVMPLGGRLATMGYVRAENTVTMTD